MFYIVLFILYNLSLIYLNNKLFEYLKPNLYPCFIYIIVQIDVILSPQISDSMLLTTRYTQGLALVFHTRFRVFAKHAARECDKAQNAANNLLNLAPIMLRDGKVELHDSFTESARRLKEQADIHANEVDFFRNQISCINEFIRSSV